MLATSLQQGRGVRVDHDKVSFVGRCQLSNVAIQREGFGVAVGEAIKSLPGGQWLTTQLAYLIGAFQGAEA